MYIACQMVIRSGIFEEWKPFCLELIKQNSTRSPLKIVKMQNSPPVSYTRFCGWARQTIYNAVQLGLYKTPVLGHKLQQTGLRVVGVQVW